jgi:hypothetical protein
VSRLQVLDHVRGGCEVSPVAGFGGGHAKADTDVALSHSGWPEQNHVAFLLNESQRGELGDERAVERGLKVKVEIGQVLCTG